MSIFFDLFGDPVPEGFGKRGRPPHVVTDASKAKVMLLMAIGRRNAEIAAALGVSEPTMRKNYSRELRSREEARFRVEGVNLLRLFEQVGIGNVTAIKELGKILEKAARDQGQADFEGRQSATPSRSVQAAKLGKKQEAELAAKSAGQDSDWGDDLNLPGTIN